MRGRRGRGHRAGLLDGVGRLQPVDYRHHLGLRREARRLLRVVLGRGRGLHGAALRVEEEVGRVEVVVARHALHRLRHEQLARAHDLRLQRELLERRDEGGRLENGGDGRADVARAVGRRLEEDLAREVLTVHLRALSGVISARGPLRPRTTGTKGVVLKRALC